MINYGKHTIDKDDIKSLVKCLNSNFLTQGPLVDKFQNNLKRKFKAKYATVVSSGTAALHLTSKLLGWKKNDEIVCSSISFAASANCILYANSNVIFSDIDLETFNVDLNHIEHLVKKRKKIKSIVVTDYGGNPNNWKELNFLKKKYGLTLVNDNCHAIGSKYFNDIGYAVKYADIVTHSYHAVKTITTGEGGSILTNNFDHDRKAKLLRNHGIENLIKKTNFEPRKMVDLGFNYRLPDILCSLGITQLKKLDKFVNKRQKIAKIYADSFNYDDYLIKQKIHKNSKSSYHLFPILIDFDKLGKNKKKLFEYLYNNKVKIQTHYIPIYRHPYYIKLMKHKFKKLKNSEIFFKRQVSLPIYFDLETKEVKKVVKLIKNFLKS